MAAANGPTAVGAEVVVGRLIAVGTLTFTSAAHFGGGASDVTDAQVLRDADGRPFLPGASLAGALRAFLRRRGAPASTLELLFGGREPRGAGAPDSSTDEWLQSALAVDDAFPAEGAGADPAIALRDRVRLRPDRRTAAEQAKFDLEVVEPGASFRLRLELTLRQGQAAQHERVRAAFNALLDALEYDEIRLGADTRRGLGRARVDGWRVLDLDFRQPADVVRWLRDERPGADAAERAGRTAPGAAISSLHRPPYLLLTADLAVEGSLLIRAVPSGADLGAPDVVQFQTSGRVATPGSSLAGALRHRALRICHALAGAPGRSEAFVERVFGPTPESSVGGPAASRRRVDEAPGAIRAGRRLAASRLRVDEAWVERSLPLRQTRIAIDRFTGGPYPGALIEEEPAWSRPTDPAVMHLSVRLDGPLADARAAPTPAERGLLLLLLKDLCTGDLTLGGEAAIGRGVLRGLKGAIELGGEQRQRWQWEQADRLRLSGGDAAELERWVEALSAELGGTTHG